MTSNGTRQVEHVLQARARARAAPMVSTAVPGSTSMASSSACARSRLASPELLRGLQREQDHAVGAVQRRPAVGQDRGDQHVAGAVLGGGAGGRGRGGDELRSATQSGSPGSPSNGRSTKSDEFLAMRTGYRSGPGGGCAGTGRAGGSRHGPARRNTCPALRPHRRRRPARRVLRPRARPRRPRAAGGVRHQRPPRVGLDARVQRGAHRRDHRRDRRVPPRPGHRRPAVHRPRHARAVRARVADGARGARRGRRRGAHRRARLVHADARRLARDPAAQRRGQRPRACGRSGPGPRRRHRRHPVAQPAARRRLQVQPAARRARPDSDATGWIADRANEILRVRRRRASRA